MRKTHFKQTATRPLETFIDAAPLAATDPSFLTVSVEGQTQDIDLSDIAYIRPHFDPDAPRAEPTAVIVLARSPQAATHDEIATETLLSDIPETELCIESAGKFIPLASITSVIGLPGLGKNEVSFSQAPKALQVARSKICSGGYKIPSPDTIEALRNKIENAIADLDRIPIAGLHFD